MTAFQLVQTLYWIALSTWFGGVLFVALSAPVVFATIRERNPILPTVLSVNLENEHGSLLAGEIVGNMLRSLSTTALGCAGILLLTLIGQWFVMDLHDRNILHGILRAVFFVGAVGLTAYDRFVLWPKVWKYREEYVEHADEPELANPAKDEFDKLHRDSMRLLAIQVTLLSLVVVFSSVISPRGM